MATLHAYLPVATATEWSELTKLTQQESPPLVILEPWLEMLVRSRHPDLAARLLPEPSRRSEIARYYLLRTKHMREEDRREERAPGQDSWGEPQSSQRFGGLILEEFTTDKNLWHTSSELPAMQVKSVALNNDACRIETNGWQCGQDSITRRWVEVNYIPRACWALTMRGPTSLRLLVEPPPRPLHGSFALLGHLGVGDFNARLRHEIVAQVRWTSGTRRTQTVTSDDQGWLALLSPAIDEDTDLTLEIVSNGPGRSANGDENADKYPPVLCMDLNWVQAKGST